MFRYVSILFLKPVILDIHDHRFQIFTLVSELYEDVDLVLGIRNIFELEGIINSRELWFNFLNGSVPFLSKGTSNLETKDLLK